MSERKLLYVLKTYFVGNNGGAKTQFELSGCSFCFQSDTRGLYEKNHTPTRVEGQNNSQTVHTDQKCHSRTTEKKELDSRGFYFPSGLGSTAVRKKNVNSEIGRTSGR